MSISRKKTVLVVDDEPPILSLISAALQETGYGSLTAHDGAEAMRVLEHTAIDLLLIDVFMPRKDGVETIVNLRKKKLGVPIIAMSGGGLGIPRDEILLHAQQLGAFAVLGKPFSIDELLRAVNQQIGAP